MFHLLSLCDNICMNGGAYMNLGDAIKELRLMRGLKQEDLAKKAGLSRISIGNYERNDRMPRYDILIKIANALDVEAGDLFWNPEGVVNKESDSSTFFIEQKLSQIGYNLCGDEDNGYLWIDYPDGILEVNKDDLDELDQSSASFLKFKLEELKQKNIKDFKSK